MTLRTLQKKVCDREAFKRIEEYEDVACRFLRFISKSQPTRIVSPSSHNFVFYQYGKTFGHHITRPLNTDLFIEDEQRFKRVLRVFHDILCAVKKAGANSEKVLKAYGFDPLDIDRIVYTIQQAVGSIGDSLPDPNQSRKRVGQIFEGLVRLIIQELGIRCDSRKINVPIPGHEGRFMSYELDLVLSRRGVIVASESELLAPTEIVGSVKTTSKDRLDKIFLDKFLLSRLLGRNVRVVAVFLHDVQRAKKQGNIFGVNSTFKSNHFLGYTLALQPLDGVYYVDRRPVMSQDPELAREIACFSQFVVRDLWRL
jgi:hypothetical protein